MSSKVRSVDGIDDLALNWREKRYDYDGSNQRIFTGLHPVHKTPTSATGWTIYKHTWVSGNLVRTHGPLSGIYDNRAKLDLYWLTPSIERLLK